ncbi:MAG: ACP S-malonyltransferase [Anaerostipes sp.]|jgi:[acyl-carrier-protein] S-malonyltransferase|nr:ACP S-malonyltransferase [Anaerostipes sp.]MDD3746644.1 ACP S-malonyltransferase [Anaerostipes sp.]
MGKVVFMFPGQGAQYVGMAKDFYDTFNHSKEVFDAADKVLDIDVKALCFEENEDINITEYTQAAMVTASVAILREIEARGVKPDMTAGLSLGEYCALVASEVMSFEDAVKTVRQRGILMQDTVPAGEGAMAAVLGMKKEPIEEVLSNIEGIVSIANYNCPGQIVISGETKAVEEASAALKEAGARRVLPLKVSGPFHSGMLQPAGEKLLEVLADVEVKDPKVPYVSNTTAQMVTSKDQVKELLGRQVYSSVCWEQSIEMMIEEGADTFIEIGPGRTLSGFMRKINRNVTVINIEKVEDLEKLKEIPSC